MATITTYLGTYQRRVWTGGSWLPTRADGGFIRRADQRAFMALTCAYYRDQLQDWYAFWRDLPNQDTRAIFWNRARYDAYATLRP